ncbi:MAG TPA: glycosyltransferase, partial [Chromatiales bacterium]|nr:glycosyltransferase [Chromatiales bacterium]HEX22891.1 glycosyltransferase [Chromatiales bacterium]
FNDLGTLSKDERRVLEPILNIIAQTGNKHRVDFIDCRSQQELAGCYRFFARRNSVFALTAFYEPFGLAPIDAAACGLAVVATQNGGPSEILVGGSGVLVDPTNAEDIARGLLQGIAHAADYARRGRRRVQMTYTWAKTAERYLEVITRGASQAQPWEGGDDTAYTALDASRRIQAFVRP